MIQHKLSQLKNNIEIQSNTNFLRALNTIGQLLTNIDFNSERIPHDDLPKFSNLLIYLKGSNLTSEEVYIIEQLTKS